MQIREESLKRLASGRAALRGGFANHLVADLELATLLLEE